MLFRNRRKLAKLGYYYPTSIERPVGNASIFVQHMMQERFGTRNFNINNPGALDFTDRKKFFKKNFLNTDCENVILSSEGLFRSVQEYNFDFMFEPFDEVKVIWIIRPKMQWVESHYCQGVKTGRYRREFLEEWEKPRLPARVEFVANFMRHYEYWTKRFGVENLSILMMGGRFPPVEEQFKKALFGGRDIDLVMPPRMNESSTMATLAACAAQTPGELQGENVKRMQLIAKQGAKLGLTGKPNILNRESYERLRAAFDADDRAFVEAQSLYTLDDLQPDITSRLDAANTLAEARASEDYARLREHLTKFDIAI